AKMPEEDHGWNRDHQAEPRVVQRHGYAVRQLYRVGSAGRLRAEYLDHADHGAEEPHQRADRRDGAERGQEPLELVRHGAPGLLDRVLHDVTRALVIAKTRGEDLAER